MEKEIFIFSWCCTIVRNETTLWSSILSSIIGNCRERDDWIVTKVSRFAPEILNFLPSKICVRVLDQERNISMYSKRIEAFASEWNLEISQITNFSKSMHDLIMSYSGVLLDENDSNILTAMSTVIHSQAHLIVEGIASQVSETLPFRGLDSSSRSSIIYLMTSDKLLKGFKKL